VFASVNVPLHISKSEFSLLLPPPLHFPPLVPSQITRKKVWELEALTDAHFMEQSYHDNDLNAAGIDSVFHATLIAAGLDLETLKMAADDRRYLDCTLEKAGISKPGDRVKIVKAIYPKA